MKINMFVWTTGWKFDHRSSVFKWRCDYNLRHTENAGGEENKLDLKYGYRSKPLCLNTNFQNYVRRKKEIGTYIHIRDWLFYTSTHIFHIA